MSVDIFGSVDDVVIVVSVDDHIEVQLDDDDDDDDVVDANDKILAKVVGVVVVVKVGANDKILANVVEGADGGALWDVKVGVGVSVAAGDDRTIFLTSLAIRSTASILAKTLSASRRPLRRAPSI